MAVFSKLVGEEEEDDIQILALNVSSLKPSKRHKLQQLLHNTRYDIVCLQETRLTKTGAKFFNLMGYEIYHQYADSGLLKVGQKRGLLIAVRKYIPSEIAKGDEVCF